MSADKKTLIKYNDNDSHVILPKNVQIIGDGAFKGKNLTSIVIPESVTEIGHYAFQGCKNLTSLYIPKSVEIIGDYAFKGCKKLNSIEIPTSVKRIGRGACDYTAICRINDGHEFEDKKNIRGDTADFLNVATLDEIRTNTSLDEIKEEEEFE